MAEPAKRKATYADLEAVHPHLVAEIVFGNLVTHPRPTARHALAHSTLGVELGDPFQRGRGGPGGWIFLTEPELHSGQHVLVPDLAGWKRDRFHIDQDIVGITIAADWVCEIQSPSTERYDRNEKRRIYAQTGVGYCWLLDPSVNQLECLSRVGENWLLTHIFSDNDIVCAPPFEAAAFALNALWPLDVPDVKKISE